MNPEVDAYLSELTQWRDESEKLRKIILATELTEELKWGKPCYKYGNTNLVIIQGFKDYCALLFFKGVLLSDPEGVLVKTGENTEVGRQLRFTSVKEITKLATVIRAYIYEAIEVERAGLKVEVKKSTELDIPEEFQQQLKANAALKKAFFALTQGRQKAYIFFFSGAKQSKTRMSRVEKCIPQILEGKGLND
ncbi:Uncharacterized conserved protein YdeI, YjbR/CyaY-like superfamily, DUF1801 family [Chitinophaga sp. YR627]|uniref:YdeI/OmpD-associated family protein n=1 Tax=Chitinophaga sp. YR627 TaxID=1881041 RepID=UPI0008EEBCDA|nr:DUF1801 domain-containing protein [Chitinophaga sp. YR627]SFO54777.1 Uncharacterized conserved protein YdeI, YjbR/CyaY-like superfamily, DUF1801 family [Chitinophaga sp. YR627]